MRPKSIILLLLAIGCGLVAAFGINQVMANRNQAPAAAVEMEKILVANKNIKVNEPFSDKNVQIEDWPKEKVPPDVVHDLKELDGQRAGGSILVGEPIRKAKFAEDKRIEEIPHGYRVVAVQADAVSATGNLLQPGDRVDIVLSLKHASQQTSSQVAKTILQNVRVFAINEQWRAAEGKDKSDDAITARTVSLLVTPDEAETIALASDLGRVRLVLRNPDDDQVDDTSGTEENEILMGRSKGNPKELPSGKSGGLLSWLKQQQNPSGQLAAVPDPDERFTMDVLKGDEMSHVEFTRRGKEGRWMSNTPSGGTTTSPAAVVTPPDNPAANPPTL
jgi:pilus assembly protein CpaB